MDLPGRVRFLINKSGPAQGRSRVQIDAVLSTNESTRVGVCSVYVHATAGSLDLQALRISLEESKSFACARAAFLENISAAAATHRRELKKFVESQRTGGPAAGQREIAEHKSAAIMATAAASSSSSSSSSSSDDDEEEDAGCKGAAMGVEELCAALAEKEAVIESLTQALATRTAERDQAASSLLSASDLPASSSASSSESTSSLSSSKASSLVTSSSSTDVAELRAHIVSLTAERDQASARAETLDELVPPLEEMRREMKGLMLEAQSAMLEAGLPKRQKRDDDIPYYYGANSWQNQADVPWNEAEKRALTPAEGIQILTAQRDEVTRKRKAGN